MARSKSGFALITDYVRRNPRTAAIAAFNLGLYAATLTKKGVRRSELTELPSKLADLVPSMRSLVSLMPLLGGTDEAPPRRKRRRAPARKAVRRTPKPKAA